MQEGDFGINSIADQRYYHFVVLRDGGGFSLPAYWKRIGNVLEPTRSAAFSEDRFVVQHRKLRSAKAFARGVVSQALSEHGEGRPPYLYDLVGARVELRDASYFLLGFPFVGLALDVVGDLLSSGGLVKTGEFVGVDVPKLVDVMEKGVVNRFEEISTRVVSLQFVVTDDKSLTAVRLGGDDPLSAEIYLKFLRRRVLSGFVRPDLCVLACEKEWRPGKEVTSGGGRPFRSRLRVDGHGNFRFYAHVDCSNLRLLPYAIGQLRAAACLRRVLSNPLSRLGREDD